jgi:Flp pilus assembly protein TadD
VARGLAHKDAGQLEDAIRDFDQALRLNPSDAAVVTGRGHLYAQKGEFDRAL